MTPAQYNEYQRQADVIEEAKKWKQENQIKQMTAVEWLINQLHKKQYGNYPDLSYNEIFDQAKEMEKQQIMDAYDSQRVLTAEQYYQETFKNKLK